MRLSARQRRLAALYRGQGLPRLAGAPPHVAVIGAGLAGLTAAHLLALGGCVPAVFEASSRIGGRIRTEHRNSQVWEAGGEFIDGQHDDMHALADHFGLEMLDTGSASENRLQTAYRFAGSSYAEDEVTSAFAEVAPRIAADIGSISARPSWRNPTPADLRFDHTTLAEYLEGLRLDPWLRSLLEVAFVTVYGLDAGEQSALNLLTLIGTDTCDGFQVFGSSDERYKLRRGSAELIAALSRAIESRIDTCRRLVRVRRGANVWRLTFEGDGGSAEIDADAVVVALPFTLLRRVDMGDLLSPRQREAVDMLGYGTSAKLMLETTTPFWRDLGLAGGTYTDTALQTSWDCSRLRGDARSVFTVFLGGREGVELGLGDEAVQAERFAALAATVMPGFREHWTGGAARVHWPSEPFALGGYTCYRPGQWTSFGGIESLPLAGGLYFAGEHCATASQGYMNGAAESGREAALHILHHLTGRGPSRRGS